MAKYIIGMLFGVITFLTLQPLLSYVTSPKPYSDQKVLFVLWDYERGVLDVDSSFWKNGDCKLETFAVVGIANGVARYLPYIDKDGVPNNYDREEGKHLVSITIDISKEVYDTVEIRTRHTCNGDPALINKVYLELRNGENVGQG